MSIQFLYSAVGTGIWIWLCYAVWKFCILQCIHLVCSLNRNKNWNPDLAALKVCWYREKATSFSIQIIKTLRNIKYTGFPFRRLRLQQNTGKHADFFVQKLLTTILLLLEWTLSIGSFYSLQRGPSVNVAFALSDRERNLMWCVQMR